MKILKLEYYNKILNWKLEPIHFLDLTLLVGVSGVGKTRILEAILDLKKIANGKPQNGIEWDITFETNNSNTFRWMGKYETRGFPKTFHFETDETKKNPPKIIFEELSLNGKKIIGRNDKSIYLEGKKTVKLSPHESVLKILGHERKIVPVYDSFKKIIHSGHHPPPGEIIFNEFEYSEGVKKYKTLRAIQESDLNTSIKLGLVYKNVPNVFKEIKKHFLGIFPNVENIKIEPVREEGVPSFFASYPFIQIKEKGIKNWITQENISSGMMKTIMHLSEMYLWPHGTVILIDEFENSLGVNCIDILVDDLIQEKRKLQFIITSHHPYIINNIRPGL